MPGRGTYHPPCVLNEIGHGTRSAFSQKWSTGKSFTFNLVDQLGPAAPQYPAYPV